MMLLPFMPLGFVFNIQEVNREQNSTGDNSCWCQATNENKAYNSYGRFSYICLPCVPHPFNKQKKFQVLFLDYLKVTIGKINKESCDTLTSNHLPARVPTYLTPTTRKNDPSLPFLLTKEMASWCFLQMKGLNHLFSVLRLTPATDTNTSHQHFINVHC